MSMLRRARPPIEGLIGRSHLGCLALMIRLSNSLVQRRALYSRLLATLPEVVMLDISAPFAGPTLPLGRYYPIIVETDAERTELDAFLEIEREAVVIPALLDRRPSSLTTTQITLAQYAQPAADWPFLLLCHWPRPYTELVAAPADMFAREHYTIEVLGTAAELHDRSRLLLDTLRSEQEIQVNIVPATGPAIRGNA